MLQDTRHLLVAIRALSNEIESAQSLGDEWHDEELVLYQSDLFEALGELAKQYAMNLEGDPSMPSFEFLMEGFKKNIWPTRS